MCIDAVSFGILRGYSYNLVEIKTPDGSPGNAKLIFRTSPIYLHFNNICLDYRLDGFDSLNRQWTVVMASL